MFKLLISQRTRKKIKLLKQSHQQAILSALEEIKDDPLIGKTLTRELTGQFSFRVGPYRIIYRVDQHNKIIRILNTGHRATIYK